MAFTRSMVTEAGQAIRFSEQNGIFYLTVPTGRLTAADLAKLKTLISV